MGIHASIRLGATQGQANPSIVLFLAGPTVAETFDTWAVTGGAGFITINGSPSVSTPSATGGSAQITVTG